jgi:phosphatidylserine decarboxylase
MDIATTPRIEPRRLPVQPLPANITSVQPGGGAIMRLELAWGRLRRRWLRRFRPGYVTQMQSRRQGECPNCRHDIVDARDLKFFRNVCGYRFALHDDRFRWRGRLGVARMGWAEILVVGGMLGTMTAAMLLVAMLTGVNWLGWLAAPPAALAVFVVAFFRDPARCIPDTPATIVAPADGTVDDIEELDDCEFLDGPAVKIGIFLSVFNVHVNRAPETGRVVELRYLPGKFGNAMNLATARDNEQLWTMLELEDPPHRRLLVKQIAGAIARRIVCEATPGEVLSRGQKFAMIKFGSRTELYLPKEGQLCVEVKMHERVRGGATVLARYRDSE